ncbi:MAG TPA: prolyl oligopeptidase family serine peptidase [Bacteroidota bacterium]|nr:prolyl oligopeptidase family serine peptidase [Bacteroidota bacterium]
MKHLFLVCLVACTATMLAQQLSKKPITHDVYDQWRKISGETISQNGKWIAYTLEPQEGDAQLIILNPGGTRRDTIARGTGAKFAANSEYAAFSIKPFYADIRRARIDKKKADDQPKDSLGIYRVSDGSVVKFPRVKSFKFPEEGSGWIAYMLEKELPLPDSLKKKKEVVASDTLTKKPGAKGDAPSDAADDEKEKKEENGTTLVVRELSTGADTTFKFVSDYFFSKDGSKLIFSSTGNDSTSVAGVFVYHVKARTLDTLSSGKGKYKQLAFDDAGTQAAFVADRDTSKAKQRYYSLYYWTVKDHQASVIADTNASGLPAHWLVSENGRVYFSKNGERLFFGTAPVPMPEDTTLYESETAKLDIWNWQDPLLQPQQLKSLDEEKKRSYLAVIHVNKRKFVQLGDEDVPSVTPGDEGNADIALGVSALPYRQLLSWEGEGFTDAYLIEMKNGARKKVLEDVKASPSLSPKAKYVVWFDEKKLNWFTLRVSNEEIKNISAQVRVPLYNEENDVPDDPNTYGSAGWTEDDDAFMVYDKYDIWSLDPDGSAPPRSVTAGAGRPAQTMYRYLRLDSEERFVKPDQLMLLKSFDYVTKAGGYCTTTLAAATAPKRVYHADAELSNPVKAKKSNDLFFVKNTFVDYPDLYASTLSFGTIAKISDSNPQQKNYLWGTVELVNWVAADGKPLDGLLYKPENFDPKKKYPMIVYFYERNSDLLHRYWTPAPSASTISASVYASNGYLVFIPDIRYEIGYPGRSAMDAIVPGTLKLISMGFVDSARIGIQGQSWGGYQAAYLITHTHMFRAAGAGAAVTNMTSAYGGIRWESGMSRMFQYEHTQSRIGGTLWEKPMLYIENSPLFSAPYCTTPVLLMNNDADGAVPWYQGIEFFTALRRLGKPAWMLVYNNEAHNLMERKNRKDLSVRMMQFFDHYLKDAPMPVWMKTGVPAIVKGKTLGLDLTK